MAKEADTYTVERSTTVAAEPQRVYEQLIDFHKWMSWSPWEDLDPEQQRTYGGPESGPGATYAWSGNRKVGRGTMKILEATAPSDVRVAVNFEKPFKSENTSIFALRSDGPGTHVTWTMIGPQSTVTKLMGMFTNMDKMIGKDFEKGLARLKAVVESPPTT
jgi:Polyketide cyclase / dehydrase and lipid transport